MGRTITATSLAGLGDFGGGTSTLTTAAPSIEVPVDAAVIPGLTPSRYDLYVKPALDVLGALVLGLVVLPLLIIVALVIRVKLGPGVLFCQERIGRDGKPFTLYKFRTMLPDRRQACDRSGGRPNGHERRRCHKTDDDPRHTPLGRFLRKSSLDELPQLWNVLQGEMSLVGPRPELVEIVSRYEPWQHLRHQVKPGLTGLWQISHRDSGLAHEGVHFDLEYLQTMSFRTDFSVLLRTVPAALRGTGR